MVSDLSKAILFIIKRGASSTEEVVVLLSTSFPERQIRSRVASLKYNNFITSANNELQITGKAKTTLDNLEFETLNDKKPWDRKWRIVIYDIPETKRLARDRIRQLLKDLGFRQLQISVWVHPLPCLKQFQVIRKTYGIEHHLLLLEVNHSAEYKELKNRFAKQYSQLKSH